MKKKALVLVFSNLKHDARVSRQVKFLSQQFAVTVAAFDAETSTDYTHIKIHQTPLTLITKLRLGFWLLLRQFKLAYKAFHSYASLTTELSKGTWDLIIANDTDALPMAFEIKGQSKAKVIFDAHEYSPRHFENKLIWRIFFQPFYFYLCKNYIPKVDSMLTVGKGLAREYEKNFGKTPVIITNATRYFDFQSKTPEKNRIKLVYHGIANPSRRLELMYDMMQQLDNRFSLDLILMTSDFASTGTKNYIEKLKADFLKDPRIKILPPVKSKDVVPTINQYDIGVFLLPPVNFNYENTLPNKLFDFIQARLAIAIGPTPEMAEIVNQYNIGLVSPTFNPHDLATELSKLTHEKLVDLKNNANKAAQEQCAEKNEEIMQGVINQLLQ